MSSQNFPIQVKNEHNDRIGISLINFNYDHTGDLYRHIQQLGIKRVEVFLTQRRNFFHYKRL